MNGTQTKEDILRLARDLINTSVEDMQSSLGCNEYSLEVLSWAEHFASRRGEKTKATILERKIKKLEKAAEKERKLRLIQQAYD